MITLTTMLTTVFVVMVVSITHNPVKMALGMMVSSISMFFYCMMATSISAMITIYFMLFVGGILIMLMILASLMPNESTSKPPLIFYSSMILLLGGAFTQENSGSVSEEIMKIPFYSKGILIPLLLLILLYFFSFITMLTTRSHSMRFYVCHLQKIL